jgi:hypothetical protein
VSYYCEHLKGIFLKQKLLNLNKQFHNPTPVMNLMLTQRVKTFHVVKIFGQ